MPKCIRLADVLSWHHLLNNNDLYNVLCCMCIIFTIQILHPYVKNQIEMDVDIMRAAAAVIELLPRMCKLSKHAYIIFMTLHSSVCL
jgi:hypothetical protein